MSIILKGMKRISRFVLYPSDYCKEIRQNRVRSQSDTTRVPPRAGAARSTPPPARHPAPGSSDVARLCVCVRSCGSGCW